MTDISKLRKNYCAYPPLRMEDMLADPYQQFARWFEDAMQEELPEPNAFVLATAGVDAMPSARTVLLKYYDEQGMVFYTNYSSRKALQIRANPKAAMLFPWFAMQRQVKVEGRVEKVSRAQSLKYFLSRPRGSQIGAWASPQSEVITSRGLLIQKWQEAKNHFSEGEVPLPDFWGGYRIIPERFEFWQGQPNRLHDRILYTYEETYWRICRLAP